MFYCNKKYEGTRCTTPTLNEQYIKNAFYAAYTDFISDREFLLHACVEVRSVLQHSFDLKSELYALKDEAARFEHDSPDIITSQLFLKGVPSAEYTEQYLHYAAVRERIADIEHEMQSRERRCCIIDGFMESLAKCPVVLDEWDDAIWCSLISKAVVHNDCTVTFHFINGTQINKRIEKRDKRGKHHTEN